MTHITFYEDSKYYKLIKYFECRNNVKILPNLYGEYKNKIEIIFVSDKDGKVKDKMGDLELWVCLLGEDGKSIQNTPEFNYVLRSISKDNFELMMGFISEQNTKWWYIKDRMDTDLRCNYYHQINEYNKFIIDKILPIK